MADRGRFSFDGLKRRRLDRPWVRARRQAAAGDLAGGVRRHRRRSCSGLPGDRIGAVAGDLVDAESVLSR